MSRPPARYIRPARWHEEFLAWLAAGLGTKAAAEQVGVHPTRPIQVSWVDEGFKARWVAINEMKEKADWDAIRERLAIIRARSR